MDKLLQELLARLKAQPFAQPSAERGFLITCRGKGRRQIFNFQLVNGQVNELAFTNTMEPALDIDSDTLDEAFVLQVCGDPKYLTGTYINYFDIVALRDILQALIPMKIVVNFTHTDRHRFNFNGYMLHEGVLIRVEFSYGIPRVSDREAGISRLMIEQALRIQQKGEENGEEAPAPASLTGLGSAAGRILREAALARAAQMTQGESQRVGVIANRPVEATIVEVPRDDKAVGEYIDAAEALLDGPLNEGMSPERVAAITGGLSGCAIAPTMGIGLEGGEAKFICDSLTDLTPEVAKKVELPS